MNITTIISIILCSIAVITSIVTIVVCVNDRPTFKHVEDNYARKDTHSIEYNGLKMELASVKESLKDITIKLDEVLRGKRSSG